MNAPIKDGGPVTDEEVESLIESVRRENSIDGMDGDSWDRLLVRAALESKQPSPAKMPEGGYYLASFKHGGHGYMLWWGPNDCGYTTDLAQAGVYDQLKPGYHDSEYTVPVPVAMADHFRIRRMVDVGDTLNAPLHSAKALRDWLAEREAQS